MSKERYRVIELFSGIGSQAKALENIGVDFEILNTCEWNVHASVAYSLIHKRRKKHKKEEPDKKTLAETLLQKGVSIDGKNLLTENGVNSILPEAMQIIEWAIEDSGNMVDVSKVKGNDLPDEIDIMTYSFPCQDLSNVGALHGYKKGIDRNAGSRSGLLWEVERILLERYDSDSFLPRFLLMENVPALNSTRHRHNFEEWQQRLKMLGYYNKIYLLNAKDFGLPQNRERLLMISILTYGDNDIEEELDRYFAEHDLSDDNYIKNLKIRKKNLRNLLKTDYSNEKYKREAIECQPNDTVSRQKIWDENLQITDHKGNVIVDYVATLTTKQDRHPNSGNLIVPFDNGKAKFRYLTPRECFLLMGFDESDFDRLLDNNCYIKKNSRMFTRDNLIKMAGNSIAVNVLEAVFKQIVDIDEKFLTV